MEHKYYLDLKNELSVISATLNLLVNSNGIATLPTGNSLDEYIPVKEIYPRFFSKPTFYKHVHSGIIILHKLGNRSFVKRKEFEASFHKVSLGEGGPAKYSC